MRGYYNTQQPQMSSYRPMFSVNDIFTQIIIVNFVIFLIANIYSNIVGSYSFFIDYFALPTSTEAFYKPWTLITHQFLHFNFWHVFNNMLLLLIFGRLTQLFFGKVETVSIYIISSIVAGIALILFFNTGEAIGASAAVYGVMFAAVLYRPNYQINLFIIGQVKIKWIALFIAVLGIVIDFRSNTGGKVAHLFGAMFGAFYGYKRKYFIDILRPVHKLLSKIGIGKHIDTSKFKRKKQDRLLTNYVKPIDRDVPLQYRIDKILDKISKKGMSSLTTDEKKLLDKYHSKL